MARPIWQGTISFGLVTVPVALYSATEDRTVSFHQLERDTTDRIRYRRVNERTGKEVDYREIVKGYEVTKGEYVVVEPEELADIAPEKSRGIEIEAFVELEEIDPVFFNKAYWLAPTDDGYAHAYHLLLRAMAESGRVGIALFVMRGKEYLTAVRASDQVLTLNTMYFPEEIRDPAKAIPDLPKADEPRGRELSMAVDLIESMSGPWDPEQYHDTYTAKVYELIENKRAGRQTKSASSAPEPTKVLDLTEALRRSMKKKPGRGGGAESESPSRSRSARGGASSGSSARSAARSSSGSSSRSASAKETAPKDSGQDVDSMSKAELDKLARELEVKGRSRMNRDELAAAVTAAGGGSKTRSRRRHAS
ncbi:MAG TPA: Ku protein [Pseudonocardiaceae bacterium]|jgi:DNA end-binding protein Ku|nr:Ku protein [Pseudonocardiaceae bacterium]